MCNAGTDIKDLVNAGNFVIQRKKAAFIFFLLGKDIGQLRVLVLSQQRFESNSFQRPESIARACILSVASSFHNLQPLKVDLKTSKGQKIGH